MKNLKNHRIAALCLFFITSLFVQFASADFSFEYTPDRKPYINNARTFVAHVDKFDIVGEEVGPEDGIPTLLVGGLSSSYPYLKKHAETLAAQGYRVTIYNPPGQGRGLLASGNNVSGIDRGMDGMLKVFSAMRHHVYERSGKKKVIVMGHSLGGLQVRIGSLGVVYDEDGTASISETEKARARRETGLIVPLFTMGILPGTIVDKDSFTAAQNILLSSVVPLSIECVALYNCVVPDPFSIRQNVMVGLAIRAAQTAGNDFYANDPDLEAVSFTTRIMMTQIRMETQISKDLRRWIKEKAVVTNSGLSLSDAWLEQQTSKNAIPTLYFAARNDGITPITEFEHEAGELNKTEFHVFEDMGHMGPFVSHAATTLMAKKIKARYKKVVTNCGKLFKKAS